MTVTRPALRYHGGGTRLEHAWLNPACAAALDRRTGLFAQG